MRTFIGTYTTAARFCTLDALWPEKAQTAKRLIPILLTNTTMYVMYVVYIVVKGL